MNEIIKCIIKTLEKNDIQVFNKKDKPVSFINNIKLEIGYDIDYQEVSFDYNKNSSKDTTNTYYNIIINPIFYRKLKDNDKIIIDSLFKDKQIKQTMVRNKMNNKITIKCNIINKGL